MKFRLEEKCHFIHKNDVDYICIPQREYLATAPKFVVDFFREMAKGPIEVEDPFMVDLLNVFVRKGILNPKETPETYPSFDRFLDTDQISILPTMQCSLRCRYCVTFGGSTNLSASFEAMKSVVDYIVDRNLKRGEKKLSLSFSGGGESMLEFDKIRKVVDYTKNLAHKAGLLLQVTMTSNGLWTPKQRDYVIRNLTRVTVSLDGPQDLHDRNRPLPNGKGSFEYIWPNVQAIDESGMNYIIQNTITPLTFREVARIYNFYAEHLDPKEILFDHAVPYGRYGDNKWGKYDPDFLTRIYPELILKAIANGDCLVIGGVFHPTVYSWVPQKDASAAIWPRNVVTMTPDEHLTLIGEISNLNDPNARFCYFGKYENGQLKVSEKQYNAAIEHLDKTRCKECMFLYSCLPATQIAAKDEQSKERCELLFQLFNELITLEAEKKPDFKIVRSNKHCMKCGLCAQECKHGAITMSSEGPLRDSSKCKFCYACVKSCPMRGWRLAKPGRKPRI